MSDLGKVKARILLTEYPAAISSSDRILRICFVQLQVTVDVIHFTDRRRKACFRYRMFSIQHLAAMATLVIISATPTQAASAAKTVEELAAYILIGMEDGTAYDLASEKVAITKEIGSEGTTLTLTTTANNSGKVTTPVAVTVKQQNGCLFTAAVVIRDPSNQPHTMGLNMDFQSLERITLPRELVPKSTRVTFDGDYLQCSEPTDTCEAIGLKSSIAQKKMEWFPAMNIARDSHQAAVSTAITDLKASACP